MKIQTFTVVAGTKACNANCPYCISKMTPEIGMTTKDDINWRNFDVACKFAMQNNVSTVLITGKGEPTLYPHQLTRYIDQLANYDFPFIELQTNGIKLYEEAHDCDTDIANYLDTWYATGLTTIALSVVHYDNEKNAKILSPELEKYKLEDLIKTLHDFGFSIRLTVMLLRGYIDCHKQVGHLINFAKENKVEQVSIRNLGHPHISHNKDVLEWTSTHKLTKNQMRSIETSLNSVGSKIMTLSHGAVVYDVDGQNICLTDCLTIDKNSEDIRQLIFFPDGHLRYDWQYEGAIIL